MRFIKLPVNKLEYLPQDGNARAAGGDVKPLHDMFDFIKARITLMIILTDVLSLSYFSTNI